jgi:hypothetical protein
VPDEIVARPIRQDVLDVAAWHTETVRYVSEDVGPRLARVIVDQEGDGHVVAIAGPHLHAEQEAVPGLAWLPD